MVISGWKAYIWDFIPWGIVRVFPAFTCTNTWGEKIVLISIWLAFWLGFIINLAFVKWKTGPIENSGPLLGGIQKTCLLGRDNEGYMFGHSRNQYKERHIFKDLVIREALKRKAAKGDHLVEEYAVTPDVRHRGEQTIGEALWRHPAYREHPWENTNRRDPQNICKYLEKCFCILFGSRDANMRISRLIIGVVFFLDFIICTLVINIQFP